MSYILNNGYTILSCKAHIFNLINLIHIVIAYFQGRFIYHPGDKDSRQNVWLMLRYDMCDPAGCLFELCVQLAIIMVGKQFLNNIVEILFPLVLYLCL